jgi:hypothetical protein
MERKAKEAATFPRAGGSKPTQAPLPDSPQSRGVLAAVSGRAHALHVLKMENGKGERRAIESVPLPNGWAMSCRLAVYPRVSTAGRRFVKHATGGLKPWHAADCGRSAPLPG